MDSLLSRYRNLTTLLVAILVQLVLLGYQVRNDQDVRFVRVWAVTAVTPLASALENVRGGTTGFFQNYFNLVDAQQQNLRLKAALDEVQLENQQLRSTLNTAELAQSLAIFRASSPLDTLPAQIIGNTTGSGDQVVLADRGARDGVRSGMGVITPQGIVGKVTSVFPTASHILLATDPNFAAGVISQQHRVAGTLKGQGSGTLRVDYVANERTVQEGEWFFTSGDDRIFPRGLPAGVATSVSTGTNQQEIQIRPVGFENGIEAVLIVTGGAHMDIPEVAPGESTENPQLLAPPESEITDESIPAQSGPLATDADRIAESLRAIGEDQGHIFGERGKGAPDFNKVPGAIPAVPIPTVR